MKKLAKIFLFAATSLLLYLSYSTFLEAKYEVRRRRDLINMLTQAYNISYVSNLEAPSGDIEGLLRICKIDPAEKHPLTGRPLKDSYALLLTNNIFKVNAMLGSSIVPTMFESGVMVDSKRFYSYLDMHTEYK